MSQRRMFSPDIVESEEFITMPISSQALYFHLGMGADDDGFVQPKIIMRALGANDDDLKVLLAKRFLLAFDGGVVVIKHWLIHNMIRADRYKPTRFQEEKKLIKVKENKAYTETNKIGCQNDNQMAAQVRLGKVSIGEELSNESEVIEASQKQTFSAFMETKGLFEFEVITDEGSEVYWGKHKNNKISDSILAKYKKEYYKPNEDVQEKKDITDEIFSFWNSLPNLAATPFKGKPTNPSTVDLLLPQSTNLSYDLKQQIKKNLRNYPNIEMYKKAIMNYAEEIVNRLPKSDSSYHLHRLSLYDFFLQKNGFTKFVNK
jgi:hypothetical protein